MAEFPALPLFTDAYLADTRHLTTEEHGAYLLLMMEAWRRPDCNLPDDDRLLARLAGMSPDRWASIRDVILAFWTRDGRRKTWTQKRLLKERSYVAQKSASQRDKATKRWKETKKDDAAAMPKSCPEDAPTPTPTITLDTNVSNAADAPPDLTKVAFDAGVKVLTTAGKSASSARAIVGKWRGKHGDEAVISALGRAQREGAVDPVAFCEGVFRQSGKSAVQRRQLPDGRWQTFDPFNGWMTEHA